MKHASAVDMGGLADDDDFQVVPVEKTSQFRIIFNINRELYLGAKHHILFVSRHRRRTFESTEA